MSWWERDRLETTTWPASPEGGLGLDRQLVSSALDKQISYTTILIDRELFVTVIRGS